MEVCDAALQLAAQSWCQSMTSHKTMDSEMAKGIAEVIQPLLDELETARAIICNAGSGDWSKESDEWVVAAKKWQTRCNLLLSAETGQYKEVIA